MEEQTKTCPKCKGKFPSSDPFLPSNDKMLKKELGDETKTVAVCINCKMKENRRKRGRVVGWGLYL